MQLANKAAIVTGAGTGIGRAIARLFAAEGASVVVAGRTPATGEETVGLIRAAGGEAIYVRTDVSREPDVRALFEAAITRYGRLHVLVNNAGTGGPGKRLEDTTEAEWDHVL